jgi:hypothetical protein
LAHGCAFPSDRSSIELGEAEDGAHCRRLSRTVWPKEADDLSGRYIEGKVI